MAPTIYLPIILAIVLLAAAARQKLAALLFMLVVSLGFGGLAAIHLPAFGGSSILAAQLILVLVTLVALFALSPNEIADTARVHWVGLSLCVYAVLIMYFGPRLFALGVEVYPMRMSDYDFGKQPLAPASSNIAHTAYFCGTMLMVFLATALFRSKLEFRHLRSAVLVLAAVHGSTAIADFALGTAGVREVFDIFRNANYAMVDQTLYGMKRASGLFPEPSSYASLSVPLIVFCSELWLQKGDRTAGLMGLLVLIGTFLSMSSAGFVGIGAYGVLLAFRILTSTHRPALFLRLLGLVGVMAFLVLLMLLSTFLLPGIFGSFDDAVAAMTVQKADSSSADERTRWAMQGFELFQASSGFGVGAGSFRSSSIVTAWLGSYGLVGLLLIPLFLLPLFTSLGGRGTATPEARICAWAALIALLPLAVVGVTPDPGLPFALFAGYAIACSRAPVVVRKPLKARHT